MLNALKNQYFKFIPGNIIKNLLVDLVNVLKLGRVTVFWMLALGFVSFFNGISKVEAQEESSDDVSYLLDCENNDTTTFAYDVNLDCTLEQMERNMTVDEVVDSLKNDGYMVVPPDEQAQDIFNQAYNVMDCVFLYKSNSEGAFQFSDVAVCPTSFSLTTPMIAEEILEESDVSLSRQASSYYSQTVLNRVRTLRAASKSGFSPPSPSQSASNDTATGINAGDDTSGEVIDNIAVSLGASETRSKGRFKSRAMYLLATTDKVINTKSVIGFGVGLENSRVNFGAGVGRERKSAGVTLTAYGAHILNDNFFVAPQFSAAYLRKRTEQAQVVNQEDDAWRVMGSLALVGQHAMDNVELSGVGQVVYTHENTEGAGGRVYVGQSLLNGEVTYTGHNKVHPYLGVTGTYDFVRSASIERFGYEISAGLRAAPGSRRSVSLSVAYGKRDDEKTKSGNLFLRVFW